MIKFNENQKTIEIKDRLKFQHYMFRIMLIITVINSFIFLITFNKIQLKWMGFIWIILGITSAGIFTYHLRKKTASEKLNISEINSLTEKQLFGRKRFSLKLTNGKWRDLVEMKNEADIKEMKALFEKIGIKSS